MFEASLALIALGVGAIIYTFFGLLGDFWGAKFGILISNNIRYSLYKHIQKLSMEFLSRRSAGDIINCFIADVEKIENGIRLGLSVIILDISSIIFSGIFLFSLNWQLAIISCIGLTFCTLIPIKISELATKPGYHLREKEGKIANIVEENIQSKSVIKAHNILQTDPNYARHNSLTGGIFFSANGVPSIVSSFLEYVCNQTLTNFGSGHKKS